MNKIFAVSVFCLMSQAALASATYEYQANLMADVGSSKNCLESVSVSVVDTFDTEDEAVFRGDEIKLGLADKSEISIARSGTSYRHDSDIAEHVFVDYINKDLYVYLERNSDESYPHATKYEGFKTMEVYGLNDSACLYRLTERQLKTK